MNALYKVIDHLAKRLEFRSLRGQRRWKSLRDFLLLILNNCGDQSQKPPRKFDGRE